jgi:hypothetical protein
MGAFQWEIRRTMIEGIHVQPHDIGIPSFVIFVAMTAFNLRHILDASVKALPPVDIRVHVFVTVATETTLYSLFEHGVALPAILFQIRMPLDDRARHDHGLNRCRRDFR